MPTATRKPTGIVRTRSEVGRLLGVNRWLITGWISSEQIETYSIPEMGATGVDESGLERLRIIAERYRATVASPV
jgi:hypothetical protein